MSRHALLRLEKVSVSYQDRKGTTTRPLVEFDLEVHPGELVVVIGDSGAGKSTLLHVITGFCRSMEHSQGIRSRVGNWFQMPLRSESVKGHVYIDGEDVCNLEPRDRPVGLVMQRFSLYPHMSVSQNLEFPLRMARVPKAKRKALVDEVANRLRITGRLDCRTEILAGGEAQRVAIGKMLLRDPRIALFDEAFSNLDPELRNDLRKEVISKFLSGGEISPRAIVFVSHDLKDTEEADKIVVFDKTDNNGHQTSTTTIFSGDVDWRDGQPVKEGSRKAYEKMADQIDIEKLILAIPRKRK